jgi:hypothetical protein
VFFSSQPLYWVLRTSQPKLRDWCGWTTGEGAAKLAINMGLATPGIDHISEISPITAWAVITILIALAL